jgi:phenylpropionate dioxygenase-like ring-hydroxylating dioxygenase large terminal subunit
LSPELDSLAELVGPDWIDGRLYTSTAIFEREIERIFEGGWVWVAHESEIAEARSFKTLSIGRQPVIVTRTDEGEPVTLLNRCRHRAATLCQAETGRASRFVCAYHGWTYAQDGRLVGVPQPEGYEGILDRPALGLKKLRTESYGGLVFASLNEAVMPLSDYLADAKPWIDRFNRQAAGYPLVVLGDHRFRFEGNWKIPMENTTDGYHLPVVHNSYLRFVESETSDRLASVMASDELYCLTLGNGHSVGIFDADAIDLDRPSRNPVPKHYEQLAQDLSGSLPPADIARILRAVGGVGFNLNLFPNIALSGAFLRELRPLSVDRTEVRHIALGMGGGPAAANRARLRIHEQFQGPAGLGSSDDREAWERVARGALAGDDMPVLLNRGVNRERAAGNARRAHATDELGMRAAYARWQEVMADA